ncbi:protein NIM1-INTERACTING 1 [Argentina anserina]|uniref:protein NIM1-INTERACTING 1 n=1 Tax=Argentina anserina TaxID=57926 RepID=UPI0021761D71|nr:protein NIM1-INTERACTING 1 [Potentilla anserina]
MEGERKKRKMEFEEEDEEAKIEKFFALIKSTRQVCEILKGSSNWPLRKKDENKKEEEPDNKSTGGAWNPAFQPEDFLDQDDKATTAGHGAGPSTIQEEDEKEKDKGGDGLDLKLSL